MYKESESREKEFFTQELGARTDGSENVVDREMAATQLKNVLDLADISK